MLNLRCFYCQTPFTVGRVELLAALQQMNDENMNHYDAHCPRCRRANSIARQRMEMAMPNWRQALEEQRASAESAPQPVAEAAPVAAPAAAMDESEAAKKPTRKRAGSAKATAKPASTKAKARKPTDKAKAKSTSKATTSSRKTAVKSKKK
jgi:hypothetical protein